MTSFLSPIIKLFCLLALGFHCQVLALSQTCSSTVLYIPLDERFTTRNAFLNLTSLTQYCVLTPPPDILSVHKTSANTTALFVWMDQSISKANVVIASLEMLLYGGLIASRISNDSTSTIMNRMERLLSYSHQYPDVDMYISNVVMRIPSYNGDFEEPWYWANYGSNLFTYSYYLDKFQQQNNSQDYQTAMEAIASVPPSAVDEFVWRRQRNHNITMFLLQGMSESSHNGNKRFFKYFYTTLDDSAEFGYNIREASEIKAFIANDKNKLDNTCCPVYPGADEVHLVMLARYAVNHIQGEDKPIKFLAVYRDPNNIDAIPSYEGQPMSATLQQQLSAANGALVDVNKMSEYDVVLFVNNFSGDQSEAFQQPTEGNAATDFQMFDSWISKALSQNPPTIMGFCDNRYANGGDHYFVQYMFNQLQQQRLRINAYAGWNTNGNTIGTIVSNVILLHLFQDYEHNAMFTSLRLIEDHEYQSDFRQYLNSYINQVKSPYETTSNLTMDLSFYEHFSFKVLASRYQSIAQAYALPWELDAIYYPWNRTFEMGFYVKEK